MWSQALSPSIFSLVTIHSISDNWREDALVLSRRKLCQYALITDSDSFLLENSLKQLIELDNIVVTPLLNSPFGTYSNVYGLLGDNFVTRKEILSQRVYYSNGPLLINLKHKDSSYLTFDGDNLLNYYRNGDPIDVFAYSAYIMNISIFINNQNFYGYFVDHHIYETIKRHQQAMNTFIANLISDKGPMPLLQSLVIAPKFVSPIKYGFDEIFVINLVRRPERLRKMSEILKVLGFSFQVFPAIDGNTLTVEELEKYRIKFLPGYLDPYYKRPMKTGEIGCFLSHYEIWRHVVDNNLEKVIILEDDIRFTENATHILKILTEDLIKTHINWDLIYLGRKKLEVSKKEHYVSGHRYLSTVEYSYWTIGYAISNQGAKKLLDMNPLKRLIALDEFLPIAYGKHPNKKWTNQFNLKSNELLNAFTAFPDIIVPEKYTHESGYVSDTESSLIYHETLNKTDSTNKNKKINKKKELFTIIDSSLVKKEL